MHRWMDACHGRLSVHIDHHVADGSSPGDIQGATFRPNTWVVLAGELDAVTGRWARRVFDQVLDNMGGQTLAPRGTPTNTATTRGAPAMLGPRWLIDAAAVSFIDLRGLDTLRDTARRCRHLGGEFTVIRASRQLQRLVTLTGSETTPGRSRPPWLVEPPPRGPARSVTPRHHRLLERAPSYRPG